ncbi:hypothetical protein IQ279_03775 [Streptomyces verrucosisporus]|uniref:hypothetical protein n=1 Tax=Streptomyces verrucosisporus TaxID=1695161 RepID=UPI0019D06F35|nr:hypothetical protein [Streptomyces verrucosisporus]MBN3928770.1 hypothetical protein [Streptomyces verrucosisporus]
MGSLDGIRADVISSQRDEELSGNNWDKVYNYHAIGAPVTGIPVVGDVFQRLVDIGAGEELDKVNVEADDKYEEELIKYYQQNGYPRLERALAEKAFDLGLPKSYLTDEEEGVFTVKITPWAAGGYNHGIGQARGSIGGAP